MIPTNKLRWIERSVKGQEAAVARPFNTYSGLVLQQWWEAEGWEHEDFVKVGGEWRDVPVDSEDV